MTQPTTPSAKPVLILFASRFGHSERIAEHIAVPLRSLSIPTETHSIADVTKLSLVDYSGLVLVASVQYGHIDKRAQRFVRRNLQWLHSIPTLSVSVSLIARSEEKRTVETNVYTRKFLEKTTWKPTQLALVAGALRYPQYNWFDTMMIRLIMNITGGVTDTSVDIEYTDWDQVAQAARSFGQLLQDQR